MKILVVSWQGIGDLIATVPFLDKLRYLYPQASIYVICARGREFFLSNRGIDYIFGVDDISEVNNILDGIYFDIIFDTNTDISTTEYVNCLEQIPHNLSIGYNYPLPIETKRTKSTIRYELDRRYPLWHQMIGLLRIAGLSSADICIDKLPLFSVEPAQEDAIVKKFPSFFALEGNVVCLGIGGLSNRDQKRWPIHFYKELATKLHQRFGVNVALLGGVSEIEDGQYISESGNYILNLVAETSFEDLVVILRHTKLVISNDTFIMHLAGALDVALMVIYPALTYLAFQPMHKNYTLLLSSTQKVDAISPDNVFSMAIPYMTDPDLCKPNIDRRVNVIFGHLHKLLDTNAAVQSR